MFLFSLWCQIFGRDIQFYSIKTLFSSLKMFQGQFFSRLGNKNIRRVWSALNKYFVLFLASNIVSILSGTIKRLDKLWWFQFCTSNERVKNCFIHIFMSIPMSFWAFENWICSQWANQMGKLPFNRLVFSFKAWKWNISQ